jgi:hypothetical protein
MAIEGRRHGDDDENKYGASNSWRVWAKSYKGVITVVAAAFVLLNLSHIHGFLVDSGKVETASTVRSVFSVFYFHTVIETWFQ